MDRNFYDNDFEEILKQKADQYKMYPSDRVWDNIYSSLHGRKKWIILGLSVLFITSSLFIAKQAIPTTSNKLAVHQAPVIVSSTLPSSNKNITSPINHNNLTAQQYVLINRVKPVSANATNYSVSSKQFTKIDNENTDKIAGDNNNIVATTSEAEPLVIENNLLPATAENKAITNSNTRLPAAENQAATDKNKAAKTNSLKEDKPMLAIQNNMAAIKPLKSSKWVIQFYASPIISYRRLSSQDQPNYTPPVSATYGSNINKYVHHQPAPGLEVGAKIQFKLSNSLSVYAGAQLNYSRYYIDAYKYRIEKGKIVLKGSADTLSSYTDIRNFSGYQPEQLQNQYWQLSIPVGLDIKLLGEKKLQWHFAGGVQPTFLINSNSYLLTSDYKNYIQSPDLARKFNVHANFEMFVSYQTHGLRLQLGPQFRSQLLSSYSNQYRVREYLTEYGIKFGISKTIR